MEKRSVIKFNDLPGAVKEKVEKILEHRRNIRTSALLSIPILPFSPAQVVAYFFKHLPRYRKDEIGLFFSLRASKDSRIKELSANFPWITVNRNGDLVGKKLAPKIGPFSVGRIRVPSKHNRAGTKKFRQTNILVRKLHKQARRK